LFNRNWDDRPNLTEPVQKRHDGVYMGEMDTDGWKHGYGVLQRYKKLLFDALVVIALDISAAFPTRVYPKLPIMYNSLM
jgi:hypothetical protein